LGFTGGVNAISGVNSIVDAVVVSDLALSELEGRLGGLINDEAEGMGEEGGLTTAVLAGGSELGSAILLGGLGALGGGVADPTLTEAGGGLSRIVGLLTARICCLAVRASGSLFFAATTAAFFSAALGSIVLGWG